MPRVFRLPDLGEGVTEGQVVRVMIARGDRVTEDQPLMEVETDKAAVEIPSPYTGVVEEVHVAAEQVVNVGEVMVTFSGDDASAPGAGRPQQAAAVPAARASQGAAASAQSAPPGKTKPASPAVRKLARQLGIDLNTVDGTGPAGRVTREDLERTAGAPAEAPSQDARPKTQDSPWGPTHAEPLTRARKAIAATMAHSASTIPHVTDTDDADVTDLDRLRREQGTPGRKLTHLPFVIKAVAMALAEHPVFNAALDADAEHIVYHDYISIAVGVHTDRGLIAPVIRNVDRMDVAGIADALQALAEKSRAATFEVNDTRGGTFTVSNAGAMGGSRYSTPIINPPQSAVLALGRTRWQPWVVDKQVVPRFIMPLSLSFDHRLIDGAQEVAFMQTIIGLLQAPSQLIT